MNPDIFNENERLNRFELDMPEERIRQLSTGWLLLAMGSLVIGGLLTIVIVLSRTPYIQDIFPWLDLFHTALVVHVDMTVLVWFLSMAGVFWTINSNTGCYRCAWIALILCAIGSAILALSPFLGAGGPLMTNYVPVLNDPIFFVGLILFGLGFLCLVLRGLVFSRPIGILVTGQGALRFGLYSALVAAIVSMGALAASYFGMPLSIKGERYFELLFWGGGHTIQFVHIQLMLVSWLWLATVSGITSRLTPRVVLFLFVIGLVPVLLTPVVYLNFDIASGDHIQTMTWLMQYGGGLAALPIGLIVLFNLINTFRDQKGLSAERSSLLTSMILFGVGGIIGFMIQGSNVTVPAHYHGSIVAVTLAYMGVTYHILPLLGFKRPVGKMAVMQPWFYGSGQLLHVIGLAWSGGYGVSRKVAGESQALDGIEKIAGMGLMGLGGLMAVIGGILFLIVVFKSMSAKPAKNSQ
ncbi:cbb3-type cytochrome c oxidase subunit I [Pseudomonadota bacterium]